MSKKYIKKTNAKQVLQYKLSGEFVRSYASIIEATTAMLGTKGSISKAINKKTNCKQMYGFQWRLLKKDHIPRRIKALKHAHVRLRIIQSNYKGDELFVHYSLPAAAKYAKVSHGRMERALRNGSSLLGFFWSTQRL